MLDDAAFALTRDLGPRRCCGGNLVLLRLHDGSPFRWMTVDPSDEL